MGRSMPLKTGETSVTGPDDSRDLEARRAYAEFFAIIIVPHTFLNLDPIWNDLA